MLSNMNVYNVRRFDNFSDETMVSTWRSITDEMPFAWFQSPQWVLSWWDTFGQDCAPLLLGVHAADELIAVAPWCISDETVFCMGDPLNDLNCLPIRKGHDEASAMGVLLNSIPHNLHLDCWPASLDQLPGNGVVTEQDQMVSPILELARSYEEYLNALLPSRRKKLLQTKRRFDRRMPSARFTVVTEPHQVRELGAEMLRLREQNLVPRGFENDCEPSSRAEPFQRLLSRLSGYTTVSPHILMGILTVGDELVAGGLYFRWNEILLKYMQGWGQSHRPWSPGTVLDLEMIRYSINMNLRFLDFGRGEEQYKGWFGAGRRQLYSYRVSVPGHLNLTTTPVPM